MQVWEMKYSSLCFSVSYPEMKTKNKCSKVIWKTETALFLEGYIFHHSFSKYLEEKSLSDCFYSHLYL